MRNILLLVAVVAIGVTAYFMMAGDTAETPVVSVTEEAAEPEETAATASEAAQDAVDDAVTVTQEAVEDAVQTATEAAEEAVEAATDAATEAATAAVQDAGDTATAALESATQTIAETSGINAVLTEEGFDFDKAVELVDASDLSAVQKTTLKTGLEQARDNPDLLAQVLEQARTALGL